jgi:hypothetical protein
VRDALIWLGCADACDTMEAIRADDPKRSDFAHVMKLWWGIFKSEPFTVREVISTVALQYNGELVHPDLNDAMMQIAGTRGQIDGVRLSGWLRRHKRTVADGKYFDRTEGDDGHGFARWFVSEVSEVSEVSSNYARKSGSGEDLNKMPLSTGGLGETSEFSETSDKLDSKSGEDLHSRLEFEDTIPW